MATYEVPVDIQFDEEEMRVFIMVDAVNEEQAAEKASDIVIRNIDIVGDPDDSVRV